MSAAEASAAAASLSSFRPGCLSLLPGRGLHLHRCIGDDWNASLIVEVRAVVIALNAEWRVRAAEGIHATVCPAQNRLEERGNQRHLELVPVGHLDLQRIGILDRLTGASGLALDRVGAELQIVVWNERVSLRGAARDAEVREGRRRRVEHLDFEKALT